MKTFDVVIIGAGIVGCACARECAQAGMRVGIVDGNPPASGATGAAMGHIVVMDDSPAQLALTQYSSRLWRELSTELPDAVEYDVRGTLWIAADEEELAEVHTKSETYAQASIAAELLDATALAREEPNLHPGLAGGLLVTDDAVVSPPAAATYFLQCARELGATVHSGSAATSASRGEVLLSDGATLQGDRIVIATGADLSLLPWLPIQKRKGHLFITDPYPGFIRHQLVELGYLKSAHKLAVDSVAFNIQPRRNGQLLIGSSRQYGDEDPAVNPSILKAMLERAVSYMPALENMPAVRTWTGFRAATPDKLPLIGPAPNEFDDPTVFLAVGFEGLGITNSLGAMRLLADQILTRSSTIPVDPYLPSRTSLFRKSPVEDKL